MADSGVKTLKSKSKHRANKSKRSKRKTKHKNYDNGTNFQVEAANVERINAMNTLEEFNINAMPHVNSTPIGNYLQYPAFHPYNVQPDNNNISHLTNVTAFFEKITLLNNQVFSLQEENLRLRNALYNVENHLSDEMKPPIDIIFRNKSIAERFMPEVDRFLLNLLSTSTDGTKFENFKRVISNTVHFEPEEIPTVPPVDKVDLFVVDNNSVTTRTIAEAVPWYETPYQDILQQKGEFENTIEKSHRKFCFNCAEDHLLSQCPHRLDTARIRKNRQNIMPQSKRYHVQGDQASNFKPGVISKDLRKALGLEENQVPLYVYNMRLLGYPPGWLSEAEVESSKMKLYNTDGKVEASSEQNVDNAENKIPDEVQFDPDALIDYIGFNVPLPPDYIDESEQLGFPPLQEHQLNLSVNTYKKIANFKPNRKRKPDLMENNSVKIQRCEEDMEVEELDDSFEAEFEVVDEICDDFQSFIPPLPQEPEEAPPPPPESPPPLMPSTFPLPAEDSPLPASPLSVEVLLPPSSTPGQSDEPAPPGDDSHSPFSSSGLLFSPIDRFKFQQEDSLSGNSSPSLLDLEEMKKKLLMELNASLDADTIDDSLEEPPLVASNVPSFDASTDFCGICDDSLDLSNLRDSKSNSLSVTYGTPSLSRHSSFTKLPEYENFSKDVSEHLNFENLPNSTGTYSRMKGVLKKVKEKLNSLMN